MSKEPRIEPVAATESAPDRKDEAARAQCKAAPIHQV
jgi:hypothetical protein